MLPFLDLFGLQVPMYWLLGVIGAALSFVLIAIRNKNIKYRLSGDDILGAIVYGALAAFIGAKLLYIITMIPDIVTRFPLYMENPSMFLDLLRAGIVYYGGLYGGILGGYLYLKKNKQPLALYSDLLAPGIPVFHIFGRIGCFFAGCCYGFESTWGFEFTTTPGHTHFPIQLVEAAVNVLIVILLLVTENKRRKGSGIKTYLFLYAVARFVLEFFRGDAIRGHLWIFSTSQWIALITVIVLVVLELLRRKRGEKAVTETEDKQILDSEDTTK